ncbi:protein BOLA4, chloroplastic/mitochondrial [Silene latifolia]|uniref:protein BOLA4, chloroplastic/mitochondrial n=1 Tax=Silene latifolia TaxID=37657 RepID=UPI003D770A44
MSITMAAITKHLLLRPTYLTMASTILHRPHLLPILQVSATRVRTLVTSVSPSSSPLTSLTKLNNGGIRRFRATTPHNVNDSGSIDSPLMQSMETKIRDELNAESVTVKDAYGDGRHVSIVVVSSAFEGKSAVNRQRMVYKAIWEELQNTVHAVDQMITKTPSEVGEAK